MSDPNNPYGPPPSSGSGDGSTPYGGGSHPYGGAGGGANPYGPPSGGSNPYGGGTPPSGPYGQGGGYGGGQQPPTDGVSIASLVLSLLCCTGLIGLILGFVGLARTKNGQRKGRWAAVTGIVVGILSIFVIGGLVAAGVFFASTVVTPSNAEVGQCVNIDEDNNTVILTKVDCTDEHDGEIVGVEEITSDNVSDVEDQMVGYCASVIDPADLALISADPSLSIEAVTEDPDNPDVGDHLVCYVEGDDLTDSVL